MSDEEMQIVNLRDDFYRDSFKKVLAVVLGALLLTVFLMGLVAYYFTNKPWPVVFAVEPKWQVQPPVGIMQPFVSQADLLQWVSDVVPSLFDVDFLNYDAQMNKLVNNFTANGWHVYQNQMKNFAPKDSVINDHAFVHAKAMDVPVIMNKGVLSGRYAWLITLPIVIDYDNLKTKQAKAVTFQVLVVRVATEINLTGIAIDDIVVAKSA